MFLNFQDINKERIYTAFKKRNNSNSTNVILPDNRGKHYNRPFALTEEVNNTVRSHINSFPVMESHYCRDCTKRRYLEEGLSISLMYRMFEKKITIDNIKTYAKFQGYRQIFVDEFNYGFFVPKKDRLL